MNEKELELFEVVMDLAIGESYSGDVEDIKKLEIKIKLIDGLYKAQKEVIDKIMNLIKQYGKYDGKKCTRGFQMWSADFNKILDILKEVE